MAEAVLAPTPAPPRGLAEGTAWVAALLMLMTSRPDIDPEDPPPAFSPARSPRPLMRPDALSGGGWAARLREGSCRSS